MKQEELQKLIDRLENEASFEHAGVKGMKWGVRNKRKSSSSSEGSGEKAGHGGSKTRVRVVKKKKKIKDMSNAELQARVARLNLERQYKQLTPSKSDKVKSMLAKAGAEVATKYTKAYIDSQVAKILPDLAKASGKKDKGDN